jgi:hypothetical protein
MIFLPYADDIRGLDAVKPEGREVSRELLNIGKILVNALTINEFDCANFEDPSIQKYQTQSIVDSLRICKLMPSVSNRSRNLRICCNRTNRERRSTGTSSTFSCRQSIWSALSCRHGAVVVDEPRRKKRGMSKMSPPLEAEDAAEDVVEPSNR